MLNKKRDTTACSSVCIVLVDDYIFRAIVNQMRLKIRNYLILTCVNNDRQMIQNCIDYKIPDNNGNGQPIVQYL